MQLRPLPGHINILDPSDMKIQILSLMLSSWVFGQPLMSQVIDSFDEHMHTVGSEKLLYRTLYPKNFDPTKSYPLVLFLHGSGERGHDNKKQLTHGADMFLQEAHRSTFPAVVIFPQCPEEGYWSSVHVDRSTNPHTYDFDYSREMTQSLRLILHLIEHLTTKPYIDDQRIYVMGLSMGGMGTFEAVFRRPDLFAAAVPICGGADVEAYGKSQSDVPFWIFHGGIDGVVPVQFSRSMHQKLIELGGYVSYTEYYGVKHDSWSRTFVEPNVINWLFGKEKTRE